MKGSRPILSRIAPILPFMLYQLPIQYFGGTGYITIIATGKELIINGMPTTWPQRRGRRMPHLLMQPGYLAPGGTRLNKNV